MKSKIEIFKENTVLGGFSIAVRDDWSLKIKRIHISSSDKVEFENQFGQVILLESQFLDWWFTTKEENNLNKKA